MPLYFMESCVPLRTFFLHLACKGALLDPQRRGLLPCLPHLGFNPESLPTFQKFLTWTLPGTQLGASPAQQVVTGVKGRRWKYPSVWGGVGSGLQEGLAELMMLFLQVTLSK